MKICPQCGMSVADTNKFCGSCGFPVDQMKGQPAPGPGPFEGAPVAPDGMGAETVSYDQPDTGGYSGAETVDYDQAVGGMGATQGVGYAQQPYEAQAYAPQGGFKTPVGMLVWSIIMILLSGIPGIVATVFSVQAKTQPTKQAYDHKVKVAKIWNIVGVVLCIVGLVLSMALACIAVNIANDENFNADTFMERLNDLEDDLNADFDDSDLSFYEDDDADFDTSDDEDADEDEPGAQSALLWPDDCLDDKGNPTMFACLALNGKQAQDFLEEQGYTKTGTSMVKGTLTWGVMGKGKTIMSSGEVAELEAAAAGTPACYVYSIEGYKNAQKALKGNAQCTIEDSETTANGAMAIVKGPSNKECLTIVSTGSSTSSVLIFNQAAIKKGLFKELVGDYGDSIDDIWKSVTGRASGK